MTDVSSVTAHADLQPAPALFTVPPPAFTNGSPALDGTIEEEESSTIKCICGYADDDGNTVLCEKCDTWQHIVCYYESTQNVPDIHECTDCLPRSIDAKRAAEKQRQHRELQQHIGERKGKPKTAPKNHKKRVKDPLVSVQPNGWAVHANNDSHYNSERKSGSPRDQPPPNKRAKTSHRMSMSVGVLYRLPELPPGSRKRAGSTMHNGHSPVKSPTNMDGLMEEFSPEFINLYRQPEPPSTDSNSYTDIRVANDISMWLNDRDALAEATGGLQPGDVFQRIEKSIQELEEIAPVIHKQKVDDTEIKAHGFHPQWQFLTVDTYVPEQGFLGEVKGHIGRKEGYCSDPANRWDHLHHPEPFVFFPPRLPLYIDTRHEGTILRYVRRSCIPNLEMKILTQGPESGYHFCLIALREIQPDDELTIGWDIPTEIGQRLGNALSNGDIRKDGLKMIEPWVANVLSNFGGCACRNGSECLLQRARRPNNIHLDANHTTKATKGSRKTKKPQVSPLSTGHATNSRAGSEAYRGDGQEDENMDSRSTSGSNKSGSRDITPATHFSIDGGDLKMSDRERRKLQQQERLFEQLEYDEQHKGKRGKRHSAGSTLNTPSLSTSKQLGHSEPSPSIRTRDHNSAGRKPSGSSAKATVRAARKPKPVYVDNGTQTEEPSEGKKNLPLAPPPTPKIPRHRVIKRPVSFTHKLLQQATVDREQRERSASVKKESRSPPPKGILSDQLSPARPPALVDQSTAMDVSPGLMPTESALPPVTAMSKDSTPPPTGDVEMNDAGEATTPRPSSPKTEDMPDAPDPEESSNTAHQPIQLPPPPWPNSPSSSSPSIPEATFPPLGPSQKPTNLQVQLPATNLSATMPSATSAITPGSVSGSAIAQSPIGMPNTPSPFSPSVNNAIHPGPARKKLSLSDYTSRRAKLAQTQSAGTSGTPPLAQSHSVGSPTLSTSSLPATASPSAKSVEPVTAPLPTVSEEPKVTAA